MKFKTIFLISLTLLPQFTHALELISIKDVAARVKSQDLSLLQNAERVYQSKEAIQIARMNLLPRLNFWNLVTAVIDPKSAITLIEEAVPFLVPNNWFRAKEQRYFAEAEEFGLSALTSNEILTARTLFYQISMDQDLLRVIKNQAKVALEVLEFTRLQEQFGEVPYGSSALIKLRQLALVEDERTLESLVLEEVKKFGFMIGIDPKENIVLSPLEGAEKYKQIEYESLVEKTIATSAEIKQFTSVLAAAPYVKHEVYFNFLGISSLSRGVMGGVFDQYPIQAGLGFGLGASLRIVRSETQQLELQKQAAIEVLKKQLSLVVKNINADIAHIGDITERVRLSREYYQSIYDRMRMGERVSSLDLIEASRSQISAEASFLEVNNRMRLNQDRLKRLLHEESYSAEIKK